MRISTRNLLITAGVLLALLFLASPIPRMEWNLLRSLSQSGGDYSVTMYQYEGVRDGMSYADVIKITGSEGRQLVRQNIAGMIGEMYSWQNPDGSGMNVMIMNGQVVQKAEANLQ